MQASTWPRRAGNRLAGAGALALKIPEEAACDMEHPANRTIEPIGLIRLGDLSGWHTIIVTCGSCARQARFAPHRLENHRLSRLRRRHPGVPLDLLKDLARDTRVVDFGHWMVCESCGNRKGHKVEVRKLPR